MLEAARTALAPVAGDTLHTDPGGASLSFPVRGGHAALTATVRALDEAGVEIDELSLRHPSLDDVFLSLTGHSTESAEATTQEEA